MIDTGLLVSLAVVYGVVWAAGRWHLFLSGDGALDIIATPAFIGLAVGRVVAVLFEDPNALRRIGDMLIIRSGVEFWPGLAAGAVAVLVAAHRQGASPAARAVAVIPASLLAYAAYAATCVVREGCFGPVSRVGLVPRIGGARQFPVEFVVAAAVVALAFGLDRVRWHPWKVVAAAVAGLALIRLVAGVWLPRIDSGWTRLELESAAALLVAFGLWVTASRTTGPVEHATTGDPATQT